MNKVTIAPIFSLSHTHFVSFLKSRSF